MPKRKRGSEDDVEAKLSHFTQELSRALKTAKGFERQRLSKRLRDDKSSPDKIQRLEREVHVLKSLDLHQAAHAHLCSTLLRAKPVAESPRLPPYFKRGVARPDLVEEERAALHNVTSALYNRKQVRDVMDKAVAAICAALRVSVPGKKRRGKKPGDEAGNETVERDGKPAKAQGPTDPSGTQDDDGTSGDESDSDGWGGISDRGLSGGAEEAAIARYEAMLGGSSDEDSVKDSEMNHDARADSMSITPSVSRSCSPVSVEEVPRSKAPAKQSRPTDSTFLPSLMAGYISGSESASDIDDAPARKKNRRGQRARQAIWEKKFGDSAKHLSKPNKSSRDVGWDPRRGAVDGEPNKPWKKGIKNPLERSGGRGGNEGMPQPQQRAQREPRRNRVQEDTGPLHPSWEAKKKAREQLQQIKIDQTSSSKIVFDD